MEWRAIGNMVILIFVMVVIIAGVVTLTPSSAMGKVRGAVDGIVDIWLANIKGEKIRQQEEEILPEKTKNSLNYLKGIFESETKGKCLMRHTDFDNFKGYKIEMSQAKEDIEIWLKKDEQIIEDFTVKGKRLCVIAGKNKDGVAAENFYKNYFKEDVSYRDKLKYTNPTKIIIEDKEKIKVDGKDFQLKDKNLMYVEEENVCFFPTQDYTGWGCRVGDKGLDEHCMPLLEGDFESWPQPPQNTMLRACSG